MTIKIMSWNIREFGKKKKTKTAAQIRARAKRVASEVKRHNPHVFALLEVENVDILELMQDFLTAYDFGFTEGQDENDRNQKEILVGYKRSKFDQVVFSQKRQFRLFNPYLRPGALLSGKLDDDWYSFLFLHTDSGVEAKDFGNRYEMFEKMWRLRKSLDKKMGSRREKLVIAGDLNTMGLTYPRRIKANRLVNGPAEIAALDDFARANKMKLLDKSHDETWHSASKNMRSDLDHMLSSSHLRFKVLGQTPQGDDYHVQVDGWNDKTPATRRKYLDDFSDHSAIIAELET